jgi:HSP20 family protein
LRADELCISGERKAESERSDRGYHCSERSYGSFTRTIALPDNAKPETTSARFDKGVLEVEVELEPSRKPQGRVIEVREVKNN